MSFLCEPYLLSLNPASEMSVVWITGEETHGCVEFGSTDALGKRVEAECYEITGLRAPKPDGTYGRRPEEHEPVSVWQHIAKITNLAEGEKVYYRCVSGGEATKIYDFHTASEKGAGFRFAEISDLQAIAGCHETVHSIGCFHPDFLLFSGDATQFSWRFDHWFGTGKGCSEKETRKDAFFPCMQQEDGARLMQYAPTFVCPGNHELDDWAVYAVKEFYATDEKWGWSIFMQLFRPLYPEGDSSLTGKRWYSADYGDMHIVSLSINRLCGWKFDEHPGWRIFDSIAPESPQMRWLKEDLEKDNSKFKWVIQHFHILNKGDDVQFNLCDPVIDGNGNVTYPHDHGGELMEMYSRYGVNAVTFGHSHVYERYYHIATHYIEAAYLSRCFRRADDAPHPSGLLPVVEDNSQRSFLIVDRKEEGLFATGYYAEEPPRPFDHYQIADENGKTVKPE